MSSPRGKTGEFVKIECEKSLQENDKDKIL